MQPPDPTGTLNDAGATGRLPFVVAASAGGKFGPQGSDDGSASDGYWRGYTLVRIGSDLTSTERQALPLLAGELAKRVTALLADGNW